MRQVYELLETYCEWFDWTMTAVAVVGKRLKEFYQEAETKQI
ncbi:hypothetical protein [Sporosarcina sp. P33]|nr:hypothetical protein [Sporosarcina sp. P33]